MSKQALKWWDSIRAPCSGSKSVLRELCSLADHNHCAWIAVPLLARRLQKSDRQIQRYLASLVSANLIRDTGRRKQPRFIPIYQIAVVAFVETPSKGDTHVTPSVTVTGDTDVTPMGDIRVTQDKRTPSEGGCNHPPSPRARSGLDLSVQAFAAYPETGRIGVSSRRQWDKAWKDEVDKGVAPQALLASVQAYAGRPDTWGVSGRPKAAHRFLEAGAWEGFAPAALQPLWSGPPEIRARLIVECGADFVGSYLDPAEWDGDRIIARTRIAFGKLKGALSDVEVVPPPPRGESNL